MSQSPDAASGRDFVTAGSGTGFTHEGPQAFQTVATHGSIRRALVAPSIAACLAWAAEWRDAGWQVTEPTPCAGYGVDVQVEVEGSGAFLGLRPAVRGPRKDAA